MILEDKKFIEFTSNNLGGPSHAFTWPGFGNQLRSFLKAALLCELTGRELIITNYWITTLFDCPYNIKWDRNINKRNKTITKAYGHVPFKTLNFSNIKSDIIETAGGDFPISYLLTNPHYLNNEILHNLLRKKSEPWIDGGGNCFLNAKGVKDLYKKYLTTLNKEFISRSKKIIDYEKEDYVSLQFRTFHDANRKTMWLLNDFIKNFIIQIKKENLSHLPIFVTTDDENVTKQISNKIKKSLNSKIIESPYKMIHSSYTKNMDTLCDWLINSKAKFIYCTGTSYSHSSSLIFDTKCMVYTKKRKNIIYPYL